MEKQDPKAVKEEEKRYTETEYNVVVNQSEKIMELNDTLILKNQKHKKEISKLKKQRKNRDEKFKKSLNDIKIERKHFDRERATLTKKIEELEKRLVAEKNAEFENLSTAIYNLQLENAKLKREKLALKREIDINKEKNKRDKETLKIMEEQYVKLKELADKYVKIIL